MVSVRRCRRGYKNTPDSTGRRCRRGTPYTGRRCNRRPPYTGRRSKACVFLIGTPHKRLGSTKVETGDFVERLPCDGVPARLVGAMAFDCLMNEPGFDQVTLGPCNHVCTFPAACGQIGGGCQKASVVVEYELARQLKEQRACRVAEAQEGRAIQYGPWQGDKPPRIATRALLAAFVTAVSHCRRQPIAAAGQSPQTPGARA